jgi:S-adenosylmethionine hydrolase
MPPIVTLTTDFGLREYFVGAVKGVILSVHPEANIVDISHEIPPHDIQEAAFTIQAVYRSFPHGTVHLVVVDPGVGSARRPIAVTTEQHHFVGPDNGVFSWVYRSEPQHKVFSIQADHYFRKPVSHTFHGRDIFAPVAAWISRGTELSRLGPRITDYVKLSVGEPSPAGENRVRGIVLHTDRFGNLITNLSPSDMPGKPVRFEIAGFTVASIVQCYSEAKDALPFALLGSAGFFEISMRESSAAARLAVERGAEVVAVWDGPVGRVR